MGQWHVGGTAGITAPAALAEAWAVSLPVALGLYNWIGLGTLKANVEPAVAVGAQRMKAALAVRAKFDDSKDKFIAFAVADHADADARFKAWQRAAYDATKDVSAFMGRA